MTSIEKWEKLLKTLIIPLACVLVLGGVVAAGYFGIRADNRSDERDRQKSFQIVKQLCDNGNYQRFRILYKDATNRIFLRDTARAYAGSCDEK